MATRLRRELHDPETETPETRPALFAAPEEAAETRTPFEQWCDAGLHAFELEDRLKTRAKALHGEAWAVLIRKMRAGASKLLRRA